MRCSSCFGCVPDVVAVGPAAAENVLAIGRRRGLDEPALRLCVDCAERGWACGARDDGEIVGIALARRSDDECYVGDLFVEPSYRGQGVAGDLLDAAFSGAEATRCLMIDADDADCCALALERGIALQTPVVRLAGATPKEEELLAMAAGAYRFDVGPIDAANHAFALDALDRDTRGAARRFEHEWYSREATGQAFFLNGEFVAYAYVWPDGRIGPIAAASASYLVQIFAFSVVTLQRVTGASWCTLLVPGSNVRVARAALRCGLKIQERLVFASDAATGDLSRYAGCHRLSF